MSNPALNEKAFGLAPEQGGPGWAAPPGTIPAAPDQVSAWPPAGYEPAGPPMTVRGTASAIGVLLVLLLAAAAFGWQQVEVVTDRFGEATASAPAGLFVAMIGGLALAIATIVKPAWARVTGPLYALAQGYLVGALSHLYEARFDGIVLQAVGITIGVFLFMWGAFASGRLQVTDKVRTTIMAGTLAVGLVYLVSIVVRLFGGEVPFIHDSGTFGIIFSLLVVGIASANLLLDFDFVQRAVAAGAPKKMEWYAAFSLLVTLVWLYLELLRLLAKLRDR